jgi:hypothetical protein
VEGAPVTVKRYTYVGTLSESARVHLTFEKLYWIEGAKTACGRATEPSWMYWVQARRIPKNRAICARCRP